MCANKIVKKELLDFNRLWIDTERDTDGQRLTDNGGYSWKKLEVHSSQEKKSQKREGDKRKTAKKFNGRKDGTSETKGIRQ
jgi:hypothetical protein